LPCAEGIAEGGLTLEEVRANAGKAGPELDEKKKAMLVVKDDTDLDYDLECNSMSDTELVIDVLPVMNTYEEYFCGLTADTHSSFSIINTEIEGTMDRRGGEPTTVTIKCDPNGVSGEFVAYLCFILPEEKPFSKFYKITCKSK